MLVCEEWVCGESMCVSLEMRVIVIIIITRVLKRCTCGNGFSWRGWIVVTHHNTSFKTVFDTGYLLRLVDDFMCSDILYPVG